MKAIITIGISGSGKSTWAADYVNHHTNTVEINRDAIRFNQFCNGVRDWSRYKWKHEKKVSEYADILLQGATENGFDVIISDTNLNSKYREKLFKRLMELGYEVEIKEFPITLEEAYKRDKLRPNSVGYEVLYKQYLQWLEYKGHKKYEPDPFLPNTVIVDVDGTVADHRGVRSPFEWGKVAEDKPIWKVMDIVDGLDQIGYKVVFLSGREGCCYQDTYNWLSDYFNFPIELYMRAEGDTRKDYVIKEELFWNHVADKYNVRMVIDDRPQVIEHCWHPLGLKVINVGEPNVRF